jgi:hypothetical protein
MRKVEVKNLFFEQLKEIFLPRGYKAITAKNFFVLKTNKGFQEYYFEIIDYYDTQVVRDGFGLRIDAIEEMLKAGVIPIYPDWDKDRNKTTVRLSYGRVKFVKDNFLYPQITNQEEAMGVLRTISSFMTGEGFAMLDQYDDIRYLEQDQITREKIDYPPPFYFMRVGTYPDYRYRQTIVARICQNPVYDYLIEKTRTLIMSYGVSDVTTRQISAYNNLIEYLDSDAGGAALEAARKQLLG